MSDNPAVNRVQAILANAFLVLLACALIGVGMEIAARVWLRSLASEQDFSRFASLRQLRARGLDSRFIAHRYLGHYPTPNYVSGANRHNSLGYRGDEIDMPKPEGEFRIVCLGGSTTYTFAVADFRDSYPDRLQRYLRDEGFPNVRVVNAGAGSWSSWESLVNLQLRVLDLDPDLLIVYHGINDVHTRLVWPPAAYRGDNSGRLLRDESPIFMPSVWEHSTLLRTLMVRFALTRAHGSLSRVLSPEPDSFRGAEFVRQKVRGEYPSGVFEEVGAFEMLETNEPTFFERNVRNMVAVAQSRDTGIVLSSFAYSPDFLAEPSVSSEEYAKAFREGNDVLTRVAATDSVPFFDFAAVFPTGPEYFADGRHVNAAGALLKAELFGRFLVDGALVSSAPLVPQQVGDDLPSSGQ